tara:strand:- start:40914 stop:42617 length:1704 start_codon:yes stop_codon:yes gene_type:complete
MTGLHNASAAGDLLLIAQLVENNKNSLNQFSSGWDSKSPLFMALENNQVEAVKLLVKLGADVNLVSSRGKSALSVACEANNLEMAVFLLKNNASANPVGAWSKYPTSHYPLSIAVKNNNFELAETLLEYGANIDGGFITPLQQAAYNNNVLAADFLLSNGADINYCDLESGMQLSPAIVKAVESNNIEMVQWLIDNGANVNTYIEKMDYDMNGGVFFPISYAWSSSALFNAIENANLEIINMLLDAGAGKAEGLTDLHFAVLRNDLSLIRLLLEDGNEVDALNTLGESPLHYAIYLNNIEALTVLAEYSADLQLAVPCHFDDRHPMEIAIDFYATEAVEWLLNNGVNIEQSYEYGESVLQLAAGYGYMEAASILLAHGADIHHLDEDGNNILQTAVYSNDADMILFLLDNGANINHQNDSGQTALHIIVDGINFFELNNLLLMTLIDNGANIDIRDDSGRTPLEYFQEQNEIFNLKADYEFMHELLSGTNITDLNKKLLVGGELVLDAMPSGDLEFSNNTNTDNFSGVSNDKGEFTDIPIHIYVESNNHHVDVQQPIDNLGFDGLIR